MASRSCGSWTIDLKTASTGEVDKWIGALNVIDAGLRPHEGVVSPSPLWLLCSSKGFN